ncbi:MAG TPA: TlpA disulfide reductase family protein [Bryobacteraceae bacterium]|nr:TlpA disulfide reductase family protein [Bryobacteraceae bacterium]
MTAARSLIVLCSCLAVLRGASETAAAKLWGDLKLKREALPGLHEEFDFLRTSTGVDVSQSLRQRFSVDMSGGKWREVAASGSFRRVRIFDGANVFSMDEGGTEYVRIKPKPKSADPVPAPFLPNEVDWSKSQELGRRACGLAQLDDQCVILEVHLKPWNRADERNVTTMLDGVAQISLDLKSGVILSLHLVEAIQGSRASYKDDIRYDAIRFTYGSPAAADLFTLPLGLREVKELSLWTAAKIKKQLAGKIAPELSLTDIQGKPVALSGFKGKTVLLDFWTTWCPPCRADGPALDKLYREYGSSRLAIIAISVSEDRAVVEKFLKEHPHEFPVVLTSENEMPPAYEIHQFPTYIVIEPDGTLASAVEGDQGFGELRQLLKKAGLEVD